MRTDARAGGYGARMGTDHMGQTTDRLWKHFVPFPEGSWAHEGGRRGMGGGGWTVLGVSDETTPTQRLLTHSHTPTHRHCGLTSHLLGDRKDLMFV